MGIVLGLAGPLRSGKSTVIQLVSKLAMERGIRLVVITLSDELRNEAEREGLSLNRDTYHDLADTFCSLLGDGIFALLTIPKMEEELAGLQGENTLVLIDGIRRPGEVIQYRSHLGSGFKLVVVWASLDVIRQRLNDRNRSDESLRARENPEETDRLIRKEMETLKPCLKMTDWPIIENDRTMLELQGKVHLLMSQLILPCLERMHAGT